MKLQEILMGHDETWVENNVVKMYGFYIVHIGDGILYCGTKKHLKRVDEDNDYVYKLYEYLYDNKGKLFIRFLNNLAYLFLGMFLAATLTYGVCEITIIGLILGIVNVVATHFCMMFDN